MRARLPHDRDLTAAERRGFLIACDCMATWAARIEQEGVRLGGPPLPAVPMNDFMRRSGRMARGLADALAITIGGRAHP